MLCPSDADPPLVGRSNFLSKPVDEETLAATLAQLNISTPARSLTLASADDELGAMVRRVAEREHWKIAMVSSPVESSDDVARTPADVIIFDLGQSVPAGMELVQRLRVSEHTRRVPLIVLGAGSLTRAERLSEGGYLELETSKERVVEAFTAAAQLILAGVEQSPERRTMANG
jgi:CheY-like chemotaxis protein